MKYAVLLLALMFAGCGESSTIIVGEPIQIAKEDFPEEMNWYDAKKACDNLGDGWRLPTIFELRMMYEHLYLEGKGNFTHQHYWSSCTIVRDVKDPKNARYLSFESGEANYGLNTKQDEKRVRAVRDLP